MLATVLFTDIVDATRKALELGDRAWRELPSVTTDRPAELDPIPRARDRYRRRRFFAAFDGPARDSLRVRRRRRGTRAGHRRPGGFARG
jgi:hypothetical protein